MRPYTGCCGKEYTGLRKLENVKLVYRFLVRFVFLLVSCGECLWLVAYYATQMFNRRSKGGGGYLLESGYGQLHEENIANGSV